MSEESKSNASRDNTGAWRTLDRREVLDVPGRFSVAVETVELPDGRIVDDYWQIVAGEYAVIFVETSDRTAVCISQYRHGPRRHGLELVAGKIEDGERPLDAARRELLEETGYESPDWKPLGSYVISATQGSGRAYFFHARSAWKKREPNSNDLEDCQVVLLSREQLFEEMRGGEFMTADHLAAIGLALLLS